MSKGHGGGGSSVAVWMAVGAIALYLIVWAIEKITGKKEGME